MAETAMAPCGTAVPRLLKPYGFARGPICRTGRAGGLYFVTFRLADSLPQPVVRAWKLERDEITRRARQQGRALSVVEQRRLQVLHSEKVEKYLDAGHGVSWMKRPEIADLVLGALQHFDGDRYTLLAWCVMPNHVHVVFKPASGQELDKILHSWKSFTAHRAVQQLQAPSPFWQPEYYDHLIRDDEDLLHAIEYTLHNPVAAGLGNWRGWASGRTWQQSWNVPRASRPCRSRMAETAMPRRKKPSTPTNTSEKGLEALIADALVEAAKYKRDKPEEYDRDHAVVLIELLAFLKATQPAIVE